METVTTDNTKQVMEDFSLPPFIRELEKRKFSIHNAPDQIDYILHKSNPDGRYVGVASRGEIVMVYGPPKSRKSTLINCITASIFTEDENHNLGFKFDLGEDEDIIYLDTEMPTTAFNRRQIRLNHICGFGRKEDIPGFYSYPMKGMTWEEKLQAIDYFVRKRIDRKTPLGLLVVDQIADLVGNLNDRDQVNYLIGKVEKWTADTGTVFLGGCHTSRKEDMMIGVIGSEFSKKMDSGFYCEKMRGSKDTKVVHLLSREEDVDNFKFNNDEFGYPILMKDLDVF